MVKLTAQENLALRTHQLNRLELLLVLFKNYKVKIENTFFYLLGSFVTDESLERLLAYQAKGLTINALFSMGGATDQENINLNELATLIKIYADMKSPFQMKTFSYSNLFYKASDLMQKDELSSDATVRIISLIQQRRDKAFNLYRRAEEVVNPKPPQIAPPKKRDDVPKTGPAYHSYQQESSGSSENRNKMFLALPPVLSDEPDFLTRAAAGYAGYTELK
jgi:hypothetical protein